MMDIMFDAGFLSFINAKLKMHTWLVLFMQDYC